MRIDAHPALQVTDAAGTESGSLGQLLLGQAGGQAMALQLRTKARGSRKAITGHGLLALVTREVDPAGRASGCWEFRSRVRRTQLEGVPHCVGERVDRSWPCCLEVHRVNGDGK